jgi:phosphohistidine phosphatase
MLTLLFLRHAKSDWAAPHEHDHERPLNARGRAAARRVGAFLRASGCAPDAVLASTAVRAQETLALASEAGGWEAPTHATRRLYLPEPGAILTEVQHAPEPARTVLVVGHEPSWSTAVSLLIGGGALRFPTAVLARVDVSAERWGEVGLGTGELVWLLPPKLLPLG